MKIATQLFFYIFIFCVGCSNNPIEKNMLFIEKQPIQGNVLLTDDLLLSPENLLVTDSLLIICNRNDSLYLEAFRLPTCQNIGRFLSKGNGPEEFIYLGTMQRAIDNRSFFVSDFGSQKLFYYKEENILQGCMMPFPVNLQDRNKEIEGALFTHYWWSAEGIIAQNITEKGRICLITPDSLFFGGDYPSPEKVDKRLEEDPIAHTRLYQSSATLSPDGRQIALACSSADMIDVYSLSDKGITTEWSCWQTYPNEIVVMPNGNQYLAGLSMRSIYHYLNICASDRFIFALYSGKKLGDPTYMTGNCIRVVNWDRSWSKELETSDSLRAISVSADGNTLYGINQTEDGYEIKTYDLTGLL